MILKPDYVCKTINVIPECVKQKRNYSELVCKMDNISVIKVTRVVIVSKYCYNSCNTLMAFEEKSKESVETKKSQ